jgi:hypothetical protein
LNLREFRLQNRAHLGTGRNLSATNVRGPPGPQWGGDAGRTEPLPGRLQPSHGSRANLFPLIMLPPGSRSPFSMAIRSEATQHIRAHLDAAGYVADREGPLFRPISTGHSPQLILRHRRFGLWQIHMLVHAAFASCVLSHAPAGVFEAHIAETKADGKELTSADVYRKSPQQRRPSVHPTAS